MKGVSKAVAINKNRLIEYHKKETENKNLYQKNVNDIVLEMRKKKQEVISIYNKLNIYNNKYNINFKDDELIDIEKRFRNNNMY